ncbi:MAG: histidine phosphatase family protein, partial [Dehalococcoidales bacterium]|nr:histidine phosphatase family protein [Dehalococcoidales bacterium]
MARIILARHGETDWNKESRVQGALSDIPLNDFGRQQARNARDFLSRETFAAVYS